ncbi:hypothetical protein SIID45300_02551 [Candidatus Magnetaquicoccaceae bacterium FCR-1]|uniref:O-methyltransferase n=2 Tax=Candidatus Magnetaquiglobus chichijimensis TaxID=3141448 RepID=A0ABQ0CBE6_9PROT
MEAWIRAVGEEKARFAALVAGIPYEKKGILFSEMFFFQLGARSAGAKRILESGRARGQSTLVLSVCFPEVPILSIEHDPNSPDVAVAAARLAGRDHVQLLFGDARRRMPELAEAGDVALIDGPKGFAGLRLAFRVLATGKVSMVFIHDVGVGTPDRAWLERIAPEAVYSDDPEFARLCHDLDGAARDDLPEANRFETTYPRPGYGFTLACLPRIPVATAWWRLAMTAIWGVIHRLAVRRLT